jgi:hypothetical protein
MRILPLYRGVSALTARSVRLPTADKRPLVGALYPTLASRPFSISNRMQAPFLQNFSLAGKTAVGEGCLFISVAILFADQIVTGGARKYQSRIKSVFPASRRIFGLTSDQVVLEKSL